MPNNVPFQGDTEAHTAFQGAPAPRTQPIRPQRQTHVTGAKFEAHTTAQDDFVKHAVQPRQPKKVVRAGRVTGGKFRGETEYASGFKEYQVVPPAKREAVKYKPSGIKFQGVTENHAQYTDKEVDRPQVHKAEDNIRVDRGAKFNDHTTNHDDFQAYRVERQRPIRPKSGGRVTGGKFQGQTEAQMAFVEHAVQAKGAVSARAREDHIAFGKENRDFVTERCAARRLAVPCFGVAMRARGC